MLADEKVFWNFLANRIIEDRVAEKGYAPSGIWNQAVLDCCESPTGKEIVIPMPKGGRPKISDEERKLAHIYIDAYKSARPDPEGQEWAMLFRLERARVAPIPAGAWLVEADYRGCEFISGDYVLFTGTLFVGRTWFDGAKFRLQRR